MYDMEQYYQATSVADAIAALGADPAAMPIAGGTDVLIQTREGRHAGCHLVSLHGLSELSAIREEEDGTLVIAIATYEKLFDKMMSNVREVKARGAVVLGITVRGKEEALKQETDYQFCVPDITDFMLPSLSILPLQLFAYYVASMKGCDIDKPRNLAKSVTVE